MTQPTTFQALGAQTWRLPQQDSQPATTPSGGAAPAVPYAPASVPTGDSQIPGYTPYQQPAAPAQPYQQPAAPAQQYQQPAAPVPQPAPPAAHPYQMSEPAPAQQPPAAPPSAPRPANRTQIDLLVSSGQLTAQEAQYFHDDTELLTALLQINRESESPPPPAAPAPAAPAAPAPTAPRQETPPPGSVAKQALPLIQSGAIEVQNGRYVNTSGFQGLDEITAQLNNERLMAEQNMFELSNPKEWLRKHGSDFLEETTKPLRDQIKALEERLQATVPPPHEAWINQNRQRLFQVGQDGQPTAEKTLAGQAYERVYVTAQRQGITDPKVLHELSAQAAESMFAITPAAPVAQAPPTNPPSFWSQASQPAAQIAGFSAPGSTLSKTGPADGIGLPVNSRGFVDFAGLTGLPR